MQLRRIAVQGGALALCAAGALTLGAGTAAASTPTTPQLAAASSTQPTFVPRDFCDDRNHRGDRRCHSDRWTWDNHFRRWNHDRFDGHRWNRR